MYIFLTYDPWKHISRSNWNHVFKYSQTRLSWKKLFCLRVARSRNYLTLLLLKITEEFRSNQVKSIEKEEEAPIKRDIDTHGSEFSASGCKKFHQVSSLDCFKTGEIKGKKKRLRASILFLDFEKKKNSQKFILSVLLIIYTRFLRFPSIYFSWLPRFDNGWSSLLFPRFFPP